MKLMQVRFSSTISKALAEIFIAEFDSDEIAENWMAQESKALSYVRWLEAKHSLTAFRNGLHLERIHLEADIASVLIHPVCFLETFTDVRDNPPYIIFLMNRYLRDKPDQVTLKNQLLAECAVLHVGLLQLYEQMCSGTNIG